jgi:hypothetical protein
LNNEDETSDSFYWTRREITPTRSLVTSGSLIDNTIWPLTTQVRPKPQSTGVVHDYLLSEFVRATKLDGSSALCPQERVPLVLQLLLTVVQPFGEISSSFNLEFV